jgi:hypothetical protein
VTGLEIEIGPYACSGSVPTSGNGAQQRTEAAGRIARYNRRTAPEPSVAYSESFTGALSLDRPDELAAYDGV